VSASHAISTSACPVPTVDQDLIAAPGVHQQHGLERRGGEPAALSAAGHRADEHALVLELPVHPYPVAEQRATRYVNAWLQKHPRFHLHFTPTSSSWCNLIERWFAELTNKAIRRGVFHSVPDLIDAIENYLANYNQDAEPFIWTTSVDRILDKIARARAALPQTTPNLSNQN
jgi:hypothetical protein